MSDSDKGPQPHKPGLASRVDELRAALQQVPANLLADRTGANYQAFGPGRGEFRLSLFDSPILVTYPALVGIDPKNASELPLAFQAVLAYYFHTSDGAALTGQWVSFADLPDGRMYSRAFQGYSGDELVKAYGRDIDDFKLACDNVGGVFTPIGDAGYIFYALPRLPLLVNYWCGDEDFPSACQILFDNSVSHYLPTDVCAILGSMLAQKLIKKRR